ncbi:MAG: methyltransferase domain-containing protein [Myxococcales bacterium]|nr:methyltransferase domain-containing protein [Myxococcales bacterium]
MTDARKADRYREQGEAVWDVAVADVLIPLVADLALDTTALVAECRTGHLNGRLSRAMPTIRRMMAVDPDRDLLDVARGQEPGPVSVFFQTQSVRTLTFADDVFGLSLAAPLTGSVADVLNSLSELARVTAPGGWIVFAVPGSNSLAFMDELLNETMVAFPDAVSAMEEWRETRTTAAPVLAAGSALQVEWVDSGELHIPVTFESAGQVWDHPVVAEAFAPRWQAIGDSAAVRQRLAADLRDRLTRYYAGGPITSELQALWFLGRVVESAPVLVSDDDLVQEDMAPVATPALAQRAPAERTLAVDLSDIVSQDAFTAEDEVQPAGLRET